MKFKTLALIASSVLSSIYSLSASAAVLEFYFTPPTVREDGTALPLAEIKQCSLYNVTTTPHVRVDTMPLAGWYKFDLVNTNSTRRYAMTCTDVAGVTSNYSNAIEVTTKMYNTTNIQVTIKEIMVGKL